MRKLAVSRQADQADGFAGGHRLPRTDADASEPKVAVLRLPAIAMIDDDSVAGLLVVYVAPSPHPRVGFAVAGAQHRPGLRRDDGIAGAHVRHRSQTDVGPVMAVGGQRAAAIIAPTRTRIMIDELLDQARLADLARHRKNQRRRVGLTGHRRRHDREYQGKKMGIHDATTRFHRTSPILPPALAEEGAAVAGRGRTPPTPAAATGVRRRARLASLGS